MKKNIKFLIITLLAFLFIFFIYIGNFSQFHITRTYRYNWLDCNDYIKDGTLYKEQAKCYHPPFLYVFAYLINQISENNFYLLITLCMLLLNIGSFFIIYKIIEKELNKTILLIPLILYLFTIFIFGLENFEMILGIFFLLLGTYLLFYSKLKYKEILAGMAFILSILTYQLFVIPFGVILIYYIIKELKLIKFNKFIPKLNLNKDIKKLFYLFFPMLIITFIFYLIFSNYISYTLLSHLKPHAGYRSIIYSKFIFGDTLPSSIALMIISLYFLIKKRNLFSICFFFTFLFLKFIFIVDLNYYFIIFIPFLIISLITQMYESKESFFKTIFFIFLIILLIYPGLKIVYLTHEFNNLAKEVGYVFNYIPEQKGDILADTDRFSWYNYPYDYEIDTIHDVGDYDRFMGLNLEKFGLVNISKWDEKERKRKYDPIKEKVIDNKYSLFIIGEMNKREDVFQIINSVNLSYKSCYVMMPTLEFEGPNNRIMLILLFKDFEDCEKIFEKMNVYYTEHFDSICKKDEFVANGFIKQTLHQNGFTINKSCNSGKEIIFSYSKREIIDFNDFKIILSFFSFILFVYILKGNKKNKYVLGLLLLLIIISIFSLVIQKNKDTPYRLAMEDIYYGNHFVFLMMGSPSFYPDKECIFLDKNREPILDKRINKICNSDDECIYFAKLMGYRIEELNSFKCLGYQFIKPEDCKTPPNCNYQVEYFLN